MPYSRVGVVRQDLGCCAAGGQNDLLGYRVVGGQDDLLGYCVEGGQNDTLGYCMGGGQNVLLGCCAAGSRITCLVTVWWFLGDRITSWVGV